jgi:hypothetical protein
VRPEINGPAVVTLPYLDYRDISAALKKQVYPSSRYLPASWSISISSHKQRTKRQFHGYRVLDLWAALASNGRSACSACSLALPTACLAELADDRWVCDEDGHAKRMNTRDISIMVVQRAERAAGGREIKSGNDMAASRL